MKKTNCICCDSTNLELILDLGNQPWCNNFLTKEEVGKEEYYPLQLMCCKDCTFLQLSYFVPKEKMFSKHDYLSGTTKSLKKHFAEVAKDVTETYKVPKDGLIIDIGGNDGTNLLTYRELGYNNLLNVEAARNIAEISIKNGISTYTNYFNEEWVDNKLFPPEPTSFYADGNASIEKAKIINASGVFFHLEEIHSVIRGINKLLDDDGVLVVQFMYVLDMLKNKSFDMIYHEHLFYYTLRSLDDLLCQYGLTIFDAYHSDIHSGSMIAYIKKIPDAINEQIGLTDRFRDLYKEEIQYLSYNNQIEKYREFAKEIESKQFLLWDKIKDITKTPKKIYALGAPAKGNTLMNYLYLKGHIQKVHEINDLKIGKYTPHTHIPIEKEDPDDLPDYYLVLAHNFFDEIVAKNQHMREKGVKFILPFPEIKIV